MTPYGGQRAIIAKKRHALDNNRRRKTHREGLAAEERAAKRAARAAGVAEVREAVAVMAAAEEDVDHLPDCPTCGGPCDGLGAPFQ